MSPKNDSGSSWLDRMGSRTIDLDALLTPEQFAQWSVKVKAGCAGDWRRCRGGKLNGSAPYLYPAVLLQSVPRPNANIHFQNSDMSGSNLPSANCQKKCQKKVVK